jgi:hypothetical protein
MSEHSRLVDEGSADEREMILAARAAGMSPEDRARVWTAVAAGCVAGGATAAGAAMGAKAGMLATVTSWKGAAVLLLLGAGGLATYKMTHSSAPLTDGVAVPQVARPAVAPPTVPPLGAAPALEPGPKPPAASPLPRPVGGLRTSRSPALEVSKNGARPSEAPRAIDSSRLAEESRLVIEARRALRAGDFATTLRLLESAATTFPNGALGQEREALAIQALALSGRREAAAKRAAAFLATYPESPHAADLKLFVR